ncbi:MAG: hypothetical protein JXR60_10565 [Bacteroidales bacterium]|nr:hypothetical protein [Bacteroidales bacterium]
MKLIRIILLFIGLFALIFSCEKEREDHLWVEKVKSTPKSFVHKINSNCETEKIPYYKDSIRVANLIRAKNVISKHSGYELISTKMKMLDKNPFKDIEGTYIESVKNKKDTLIVKIIYNFRPVNGAILGIEYIEENELNFICQAYCKAQNEEQQYYMLEYTILKRKWTRLSFKFENQDIAVLKNCYSQ